MNFSNDDITNRYCEMVLHKMADKGKNAVIGARSLFLGMLIPESEMDTIIGLLKERDFITVTKNPEQNRDLHLTWKGKAFVDEQNRNADIGMQFPHLNRKPVNKPLPWGNILAVAAIIITIVLWLLDKYYFNSSK